MIRENIQIVITREERSSSVIFYRQILVISLLIFCLWEDLNLWPLPPPFSLHHQANHITPKISSSVIFLYCMIGILIFVLSARKCYNSYSCKNRLDELVTMLWFVFINKGSIHQMHFSIYIGGKLLMFIFNSIILNFSFLMDCFAFFCDITLLFARC